MSSTFPRLLLVDDDPEESYLMQMALADVGWRGTTSVFASAAAMLHYLTGLPREALPSLLLLDYHMPGINGGQLLRLLKQNAAFAHLPVALYSSNLAPVLEQTLLHDGAIRCFRKAQNTTEALAMAEDLQLLAGNPVQA